MNETEDGRENVSALSHSLEKFAFLASAADFSLSLPLSLSLSADLFLEMFEVCFLASAFDRGERKRVFGFLDEEELSRSWVGGRR